MNIAPSQLLSAALDYAYSHGIIKYNLQHRLTHIPFILNPLKINRADMEWMIELTPIFNQLLIHIIQDHDFLKYHLSPLASADPFIELLLSMLQEEDTQPCHLIIQRNDFFLTRDPVNQRNIPKQVEINPMAAGFLTMSERVNKMHQYLYGHDLIGNNLLLTAPVQCAAENIDLAFNKHYHMPEACLLMIVQPNERNIFDQRGLEYRLLEQYGIFTLRMTMDEVGQTGKIREGHLWVQNKIAAITYFRAGYTPDDFLSQASIDGRILIEKSSTIKIPDIPTLLAGTKKIQQVLTKPEILRKFLREEPAAKLMEVFVGIFELNESLGDHSAEELAMKTPQKYVLKPQREGGGNNIYGINIAESLRQMSNTEKQAFILMERIQPLSHESSMVIEHQAEAQECVSEIGRYGVCLSEHNRIIRNEDAGYLVRTKSIEHDEGGVSAGYAGLNSLYFEE
ncbi:MAG: glutathione synthase [SAR324 cluster bacterium]|nr:glutathione synthase [SAR324 cluster bacterium]